jgi:sugar O-acyltransferase (sialic acid O-acetyltransferase NeuD family)
MAKVVLFGNGEVASVAYAYLTHDSPHDVVAFTIDRDSLGEGPHQLFDLPVVPFEDVDRLFPPSAHAMFVSVSYRKINKLRAEKYNQAKAKGYELISYVNSKALTWPDLKVGDNCFIMEENVIQPFVEIGNDVIMWSGNHIGHHTVIKDHCFVASHVVISGHVTVEPYCFFGVNATIRDGITIARECVIGAGALILKPTQEREVYVGNQATLLPRTSDQLRNI